MSDSPLMLLGWNAAVAGALAMIVAALGWLSAVRRRTALQHSLWVLVLVTLVTPYVFYFNCKLSHCGVNVFLVAKAGADWKIVSLVDTNRRGEGT